MKKLYYILFLLAVVAASCADDDSFTTSRNNVLTFSRDSIKLDTLFSNVPSAAKTFWVYNNSDDGLRCSNIRLERGGESGFRVNVDGIYLGEGRGWQTDEVEIRKGDSIRVFVETTLPRAASEQPTLTEDNLVFTLESGVEQKVNLSAWAWNARLLNNVHITSDSVIGEGKEPIVIQGGLSVDSGATLTVRAGTTLYFNSKAGMDIYGTLKSEGTATDNVTFRGDRIDHMFDYLPYDRVPAQWMGIRLHSSSFDNEIKYTDIHSTNTGISIDSSDVSREKLLLANSTIHNCQGYGLYAENAKLTIENTQITNTLRSCVHFEGGDVKMNGCTVAQFYPFDGNRGAAFSFTDAMPLRNIMVSNSLITGYADDEFSGSLLNDSTATYLFDHCMIRTPKVETKDSIHFTNVIYEDVKDTISMGKKHFRNIDEDNLIYDFRLDSVSAAISKADKATSLPYDRNGVKRDDKPDMGAYEYEKH